MNKTIEERAKEASIVEVAFKRAYSLGHTCGQVDDGYYADQCWLAFESENKSAIAGATEAQDDWKRVEELEKALDQIKNLIIIHELQMGSVHRKNVLDIIKRNLPTLKR